MENNISILRDQAGNRKDEQVLSFMTLFRIARVNYSSWMILQREKMLPSQVQLAQALWADRWFL